MTREKVKALFSAGNRAVSAKAAGGAIIAGHPEAVRFQRLSAGCGPTASGQLRSSNSYIEPRPEERGKLPDAIVLSQTGPTQTSDREMIARNVRSVIVEDMRLMIEVCEFDETSNRQADPDLGVDPSEPGRFDDCLSEPPMITLTVPWATIRTRCAKHLHHRGTENFIGR